MASFRRLPSGKHQASVWLPSGKRITRTDPLKKVVRDWAANEEARIARGEWRDPRAGRLRYEEWRDEFIAARVVESSTARRDRGLLANHLDPAWEGWMLPAIKRMSVQAWVKRMHSDGVGPSAVRMAYQLLSTMLQAAVDDDILADNPCRRIDLPAAPPKLPEWFTFEQVEAIAAELPERHQAATWLMAWCGLRWGECAGLRVGRVAFLRRRLAVDGVNTQFGEWKPYPKSSKSRREISAPAEVLERLSPLAAGKQPEDLMFLTTRKRGGEERPWSHANWLRAWRGAVQSAREARPELEIPDYAPHALRHTAASWLVQDGVPLYDVQRLLGHESFAITARYAHLQPDAHDSIERAWQRMRDRRSGAAGSV